MIKGNSEEAENRENNNCQMCKKNVAKCFLEAQVNLKLFDVRYVRIHIFGRQKCFPLYKFYNKPIFNYTYQNNNKILLSSSIQHV